ncbi:MAG: DUF1016 N-terminal domain-containing protein [Rikenellaceae bacterium]
MAIIVLHYLLPNTPYQVLSWSHYKRLLRVTDNKAREWYQKEAGEQIWSFRTLDRNFCYSTT